jgi:hypothetical protein
MAPASTGYVDPWGGSNSFGGTGQHIFQSTHIRHIANALHDIADEHAKEFMTDWFVGILEKDHSNFDPKRFRMAVERGNNAIAKSMRFQARHFYYLAHFVCQIEDENIKDFVAHWLGEIVGRGNPEFRPARWKKFCGLELAPGEEKQINAPRKASRYNDDTGRWERTDDPGRGFKDED